MIKIRKVQEMKNKEKEKIAQKNNTSQRGITLIALVITIIVMLILVAVTITMAINGFENAGRAVGETQNELDKEQQIADGKIQIDGVWYNSIDDYLAEIGGVSLPAGWEEKEKPEGWSDKVTAITDGTHTVPLPNGYEIIEGVEGETSVEKGLVIKDGYDNEFVWIPVTEDLSSSYSSSSGYSEPTVLEGTSSSYGNNAYDSQDMLNHLYGTNEDGENYYNYAEDFKYVDEYADMLASVNKYDGFYIGRYETTIDEEGNVGSKYNTRVLIADSILKEGTNPNRDDEPYYYRWYGLYYATKNANVEGNGEYVQTAMIYGVLWDKTMEYIRAPKTAGNTTYDVDTATSTWHGSNNGHTGVVKSGQANAGDVALNIWDLESNAYEWTQEANRYQ